MGEAALASPLQSGAKRRGAFSARGSPRPDYRPGDFRSRWLRLRAAAAKACGEIRRAGGMHRACAGNFDGQSSGHGGAGGTGRRGFDRRAFLRSDCFHGGISGREDSALPAQIRVGVSAGSARGGAQYFGTHAPDRHHQSAQSQRRAFGGREIAHRMGAHVLVDEVYLEACFDSPWQTAYSLGPNFVATSSLTKAYGLTGLRCGWIFAAKPLAERMWR